MRRTGYKDNKDRLVLGKHLSLFYNVKVICHKSCQRFILMRNNLKHCAYMHCGVLPISSITAQYIEMVRQGSARFNLTVNSQGSIVLPLRSVIGRNIHTVAQVSDTLDSVTVSSPDIPAVIAGILFFASICNAVLSDGSHTATVPKGSFWSMISGGVLQNTAIPFL